MPYWNGAEWRDNPIHLRFVTVHYTDWGCRSVFPDGTEVGAYPHPEMPHYSVVSHRCGYGDDLLAYCREHEVAHSLVAEFFTGSPSSVLWALAHDQKPKQWDMLCEELMAQTLQRFVRAKERPIVSGCDWDGLRDFALAHLDGASQ